MEVGNKTIEQGRFVNRPYGVCKMANKEQLAILKQGMAAWNKWREENPDAKIDLSGEELEGLDLSTANFRNADVRGTIFRKSVLVKSDFTGAYLGFLKEKQNCTTAFSKSNLTDAVFDKADIESLHFHWSNLSGTSWRDAKIKHFSCFYNVLADRTVLELLVQGSAKFLPKTEAIAFLKGKNFEGTRLVNFDLRDADFRETRLMKANLSGADITGAKLWGAAREGWIIDGIRCEYVYWDEAGKQRTPPDRNFRPGEFEELYKQLPTFEYVFAQGFTPLDPLIMDRVVQAVNEQHKEFSLELVNFDKRGQPHATFTVCRLDYVDSAKKQIEEGYERNRIAPERQGQLMAAVLGLIENQSKSLDIIKQLGGAANMGDIYNISGGQIGAIGQHASASGNTFQQITPELSRLHEAMRNAAANPEQNAAADEVAKAEEAAKQKDEPKMRQHLKNAGKFALDCAQKIGSESLAEYLKKMTLGM
jgi:uncharacterized protein YjbI with pentapeptide repeats